MNLAGTLIFSTRMWPRPSRSRPIVGKLLSRSSFLRRTVSKGMGGAREYLPTSFHNRSSCYGARVPGGVFSSLISALSPGMRRRPLECSDVESSLQNACLADECVVKNWKSERVPSLEFFFPGTNVPFCNGIFFSGVCGLEHSEFERLCVCVRTTSIWSQNFIERDVGSGWRRGGMAEDICVFEDQGWYGLVALDGGYLLVYFLLGCDITSRSSEGYSTGCLSVPDVFFLP